MSEIGNEIVIIFLLIVANGVFAMSEMAVITARKSRLQDWVSKGNRRAKIALELARRAVLAPAQPQDHRRRHQHARVDGVARHRQQVHRDQSRHL